MDTITKLKIKNIQDYIVNLYNLKTKTGDYNAEAYRMTSEKSFEKWCESFKIYTEEVIKEAIDKFFKTKNNRTAPKINQLLMILTGKKEEDLDFEPAVLRKPICPITDWQDDFEVVCRSASIQGICYIPYYNNQEEIITAHKEFIKKPFAVLKAKDRWNRDLEYAKSHDVEVSQKISNYHWLVQFTWAYRIGALSL